MKEIVVVSGKGGVGKTTITASLAYLFSKNGVRFISADTDVDAPNLALVLEGEKLESNPVQAAEIAEVNYDLCNGCGECVKYCKEDALAWDSENNRPVVIDFLCEGCGACAAICEVGAIQMKLVENAYVEVIRSKYGFLVVTGRLKVGGANSGRIVSLVKMKARSIAVKEGLNVILIDGPPGSSCPAIAAVAGSNYVILVSEPTPTAIHDLSRIYAVVSHFGIPAGLIINKCDLEPKFREKLIEFSKENGIELLGEIPLDDDVPRSIAYASPLPEFSPNSPASKEMVRIGSIIMDRILPTI
ncbi:MAG: nucleotide-binding protein [Candidatus Baldrarchaeia archaeon]